MAKGDRIIKTTEPRWFIDLVDCYRNKVKVTLIDDANIGVDPINHTLLEMGLKAKLSREEWTAVLVSLGVGIVGIALIVAAFLDPEPTSKLALIVAAGVVLVGSGGFFAIYILTRIKPPTIKVTTRGFEMRWE